jgi:uncharacterized protein YutE (UPF0331/DUF86 family)
MAYKPGGFMHVDDVILAKRTSIERCIAQIEAYLTQRSDTPFAADYLTQDAVTMNIQRACESCIDIANRVVRLRRLGSPKESRDCFVLLAEAGIIDTPMLRSMLGMVGFRNILVHQYTRLDPTILQSVMTTQVYDTLAFAQAMAIQPE